MKKYGTNSAQSGFTLIELIVVMVILGIMAATALPKLVDMGADARKAKINALAGAINGVSTAAHASWLAQGSPAAGTTVAVEGSATPATIGTAGYLTADADGMGLALGSQGDYNTVTDGADYSTDGTHLTCHVTYSASTGKATVVTTGC